MSDARAALVAGGKTVVGIPRQRLHSRADGTLRVSELPQDRREVLLLHDLEGWTHREIAERMGLPPGTVRSHLHHARRRMRSLLPELEEGEE